MLHVRRVPECRRKSLFKGRHSGTLFEGMIVGCAPKVPHKLGMKRLMNIEAWITSNWYEAF